MRVELIEMINNRMNTLVRENGFKGSLIIHPIENWGLIGTVGRHLLEPTEYELIDAIQDTELKTLVVYY